jgi:hypothetical protein
MPTLNALISNLARNWLRRVATALYKGFADGPSLCRCWRTKQQGEKEEKPARKLPGRGKRARFLSGKDSRAAEAAARDRRLRLRECECRRATDEEEAASAAVPWVVWASVSRLPIARDVRRSRGEEEGRHGRTSGRVRVERRTGVRLSGLSAR